MNHLGLPRILVEYLATHSPVVASERLEADGRILDVIR
jgi:hypothetical protein